MNKILYLLLAFFALSCTKTEQDPFPYGRVNLELDLTFEDKDLNGVMAYKTYILGQTSGLSATEFTGVGGVLVYHDVYGYSAYDLACPYERHPNIRVEMDEDAINAICPKCGSAFNVFEASGAVVNGPATQGLKRYNTHQNGNKIYVIN